MQNLQALNKQDSQYISTIQYSCCSCHYAREVKHFTPQAVSKACLEFFYTQQALGLKSSSSCPNLSSLVTHPLLTHPLLTHPLSIFLLTRCRREAHSYQVSARPLHSSTDMVSTIESATEECLNLIPRLMVGGS